jgi:hypothetical protein
VHIELTAIVKENRGHRHLYYAIGLHKIGLPDKGSKKKTRERKVDEKAEKTVRKGKHEEEEVKNFKASDSDEDDD